MTKAASLMLSVSMTLFSLLTSACGTEPPKQAAFNYQQPAAEGEPVDDAWFDDSVFIGHSLIEGFAAFGGLDDPTSFAKTGFSVKEVLSYKNFELPDGTYGSLADGLSQESYGKVYLMLGINEVANSQEQFREDYAALLDLVREYQPDAAVYVIATTPTTKHQSDTSLFNRDSILAQNEVLRTLCGERECIFVNLFECFADENGYLPSSASADGIHLKSDQYPVMLDYLKRHTALSEA